MSAVTNYISSLSNAALQSVINKVAGTIWLRGAGAVTGSQWNTMAAVVTVLDTPARIGEEAPERFYARELLADARKALEAKPDSFGA